MGIRLIIPAVRNERVKKVIKSYAEGNTPSVMEYKMGSKVYLVIAQKKMQMISLIGTWLL